MPLLEDLGRLVLEKRSGRGVREVAKEIGISHATLSRVEKGFHPDLLNYQKICRWLGVEPETMRSDVEANPPMVHFRRKSTVTQQTAHSLANLIILARKNWPHK